MIVQLLAEVCSLNYSRHFHQHLIVLQAIMNKRSKGTQALCILMWVCCVGSIESGCTLFRLDGRNLIRGREEKLGLSINETRNEPAGRRAVYLNPLACDPLHRINLQ